jgi:DNA-binding ferritin-like protein (Dps family)
MAKLKMYEIDAIVNIIVSKIKEHNQSKITEPSKKEIEVLQRKHALKKQAEAEYEKATEEFYKKYPNHSIDTWRKGTLTVEIPSSKVEVDWTERGNIKNKIILSQVTGNNVEKLIDSIVKEYTK